MQPKTKNNPRLYYKGNKKLRNSGVEYEYTEGQIEEIKKCSEDAKYFIREYCKIINVDDGLVPFDLWPFQEKLVDLCISNRKVIAMLPRQMGKSTTICCLLLWHIIFNDYFKVAILSNRSKSAKGVLKRIKLAYENLPYWMQHGILEWNAGNIELENKSSIVADSTSGSAARGDSFSAILLDEFSHVERGMQEDFFKSAYPTVSSGKTTKTWIISTPNGMEMFYDMYTKAEKRMLNPSADHTNSFVPFRAYWYDHPHRDEEWKNAELENMTLEMFNQEYDCEFLSSPNTLIDPTVLKGIEVKDPLRIWSKQINLKIYEEPVQGRSYIACVDIAEGVGKDSSVVSVIDITESSNFRQVAVYRDNKISVLELPQKAATIASFYNEAHILIENNSLGSHVGEILHTTIKYPNLIRTYQDEQRGVILTQGYGKKKSKIGYKTTAGNKLGNCKALKSLIEGKKLHIWDWNTFSEFTTFVYNGSSYSAEEKTNDDCVMSLVLFAWLVTQREFEDMFGSSPHKELAETMEDEEVVVPSSGIVFPDNYNKEEMFVADGCVWTTGKFPWEQ